MDNEALLKNKIMDVANRSFRQNIYTYTNFLDINGQSIFAQMKNTLNFVAFKSFGGNDACERQMIQFGSYETLGYEEDFPITLIKISPLIEKYAESLSHRDYLGALMNLGIKREMLGDITTKGKDAYLYCVSHIADFIIDNLSTVKHTHIQCTKTDINNIDYAPELEDGVLWNDPDIGIDWNSIFDEYGIEKPILSDKDVARLPLSKCKTKFRRR